jgi:hypothetical protein
VSDEASPHAAFAATVPPIMAMISIHNDDLVMFEFSLPFVADVNQLVPSDHFASPHGTPMLEFFFGRREATPLMAAAAHGNEYFVERLLQLDGVCVTVAMAQVGALLAVLYRITI